MASILLVDDDPHIREVVRFALGAAGFEVIEAEDGRAALATFHQKAPDLVVLDIGLPELDGHEVCRAIRAKSQTPILFLSSRTEEVERILALELGGDDYLGKPFSPRELTARVRAILRRGGGKVEAKAEPKAETDKPLRALSHRELSLDEDLFKVTCRGQPIALTATEFAILRVLLRRPGKVFRRDELIDLAYGRDIAVSDRTIDSHVRHLRQKLAAAGGDFIETVHGVGYRLSE